MALTQQEAYEAYLNAANKVNETRDRRAPDHEIETAYEEFDKARLTYLAISGRPAPAPKQENQDA